ncbi:MAG TPA: DOMON-like domain-containing protein [Steroidobacteraceae bacterium]|nr:DOMON-like domain-containing protein [Steroidobacteraceae bacterium]
MSDELPPLSLCCHPETPCAALAGIDAHVHRQAEQLAVRYALRGDPARLRLPGLVSARRTDELWRHTCCEAFVAPQSVGGGYLEWNLAPSGQWAAYRFSDYRQGMTPAAGIEPPAIRVACDENALTLEARLSLGLPAGSPARLALAVVVEEVSGRLSYWALRHAPGRADFHHPRSFALDI